MLMAKKLIVGDLTDEEIMRVARMRTTESAASTFTENSLDTQLSVERGVIWLIHWIEFMTANAVNLGEVAQGNQESILAQVTRESKTAILPGNDSDIVQQYGLDLVRSSTIGTDTGPLYYLNQRQWRVDFPRPLPYASQNVYLGVLGSDATALLTMDVRIGYSIRTVSDKFFFRVAQALLG